MLQQLCVQARLLLLQGGAAYIKATSHLYHARLIWAPTPLQNMIMYDRAPLCSAWITDSA